MQARNLLESSTETESDYTTDAEARIACVCKTDEDKDDDVMPCLNLRDHEWQFKIFTTIDGVIYPRPCPLLNYVDRFFGRVTY